MDSLVVFRILENPTDATRTSTVTRKYIRVLMTASLVHKQTQIESSGDRTSRGTSLELPRSSRSSRHLGARDVTPTHAACAHVTLPPRAALYVASCSNTPQEVTGR